MMLIKVLISAVQALAFREAGVEPPRRPAPMASHLSRYSRWSLAPSVPINRFKGTGMITTYM
ncbi:hypothetical protein [Cytobacillus oceanisediminis]|uniref:hypothetical protein n=1 Tax=Cytobacillus oceanisediminis TaxID=665099 RepID=UPI00115A782E|nr:hypothetical protein [Cytobacillus oceanisediminis]